MKYVYKFLSKIMKKALSLTFILLMLFNFTNTAYAENTGSDISIISPISGETVSTFQSISVKTRNRDNIKPYICILSEDGSIFKELLSYYDGIWYFNWNTEKFQDGNYYILSYFTDSSGKAFESEVITVVVNNTIPPISVKVNPSLLRSGMNVSISLSSQAYLTNVYAVFEEGLKLPLIFSKEENLWKGIYNVPPTINEGSHTITFECNDANGNTIPSKASFMVCNSEPIISFPKNGSEFLRENAELKGLFKPEEKVYIFHNNKFIVDVKTDLNGYWEIQNLKLISGNNSFSVYSQKVVKDFSPIYPTQTVNIKYLKSGLMVLNYHSITPVDGGLFNRTPEQFREDLNYLKQKGYNTVSPALFISFLEGKAVLPDKSILITFDDGLVSIYKNAYKILKEFDYSGLFFVIVSRVGLSKEYVDWDQLLEMQSSRVLSIESHTFNSHYMVSEKEGTHTALTSRIPLPDGKLESYDDYKSRVYNDLKLSKEIIEKNLNKKVQFLSVPFGNANKEVRDISLELGFKAVFSSGGGINELPLEKWNIKRVTLTRDDKLEDILF